MAKENKKSDGTDSSFFAKYMSKKSALETKKDDCIRKIRELGLIPENALAKYNALSVTAVSLDVFLLVCGKQVCMAYL